MSALRYWIWLARLRHVGAGSKRGLLERFGTAERVFLATAQDYRQTGFLSQTELEALLFKDVQTAARIEEKCDALNVRIVTLQDASYPSRLKNISDPPLVLYVKGKLPDVDSEAAVAVVGTRKSTPYGMRISERLSFALAKGGALIVTGLAGGIDSSGAWGALKAGGKVIGVLGCGIDTVYPAWNAELFRDVEASGALVSEYPPGDKVFASNFPARNRIISGLSLGVTIIEAPAKSGALITAERALEQGRDVFVVPGNIDADSFRGSNALLKEGATPITQAQDVLKEYEALFPDKITLGKVAPALARYDGNLREKAEETAKAENKVIDKQPAVEYKEDAESLILRERFKELSEKEQKLLLALPDHPVGLNSLPQIPGVDFLETMELLTSLKLNGFIKELPGGKYAPKYRPRNDAGL